MSGKRSISEDVRIYCKKNYIEPVRNRNENGSFILIKPGDIRKELGLSVHQINAVCAAIGTSKFEAENNIKRISITGSFHGKDSTFIFTLLSENTAESLLVTI